MMTKKQRQQVHSKYCGHCAYCGREITIDEMQVDHFDSHYGERLKGGNPDNDISNLMPSCAECNRYKGANGIEDMRRWLEKSKGQLLRTQNLRILNRLGGFAISGEPIMFYYEKKER